MKLPISTNNHTNVQKNDEKRLSSHSPRFTSTKTSFLIALIVIALVCLVSSCTEQEVEIIEPPKQPPPSTLPDSINVNNLYFSDELSGWLSVTFFGNGKKYKGGLFKTTNGGVSWNVSLLSEQSILKMVCFTDRLHGWSPGNKGILFSTSDGGITWVKYDTRKFLGEEDTLYNFVRIYFRNCNEGWIVGSKVGSPIDCGGFGYLFHTTNGGNDWSIQYTTTDAALTDVDVQADGSGCIVGGGHFLDCDPFISRTSNSGGTWVRQDVGPYIQGHVGRVQFRNSFYGFIFDSRGLLRTTNGGLTWDTIGTAMGAVKEVCIVNDSVVYAAFGSPAAIYKSTDQGKNWKVDLQSEEHLTRLFFLNDSTGWAEGIVASFSRAAIYKLQNNSWAKIR